MRLLSIIILFVFTNALSQNYNYKITYDYTIVSYQYNYTNSLKSYLYGNGTHSLYEEDFIGENSSESENSITIKSMENNVFYKDIITNVIHYNDDIQMKKFYIKDTLSNFEWKIKEESKMILGYNCQKATLFFRGTNYEVYFTTEIPYHDGPWKFSGLPGMILESKSYSPSFSYQIRAEKIELLKSFTEIENPHLHKKTIPYEEFVKIYKNKYNESVANQIQNPGSFVLPKGYQEIYVND